MSNALAHRTGAAVLVGGYLLAREGQEGKNTHAPITGSILAAICTNIPDWLEPAVNPHHRQFFHSITFAAMIGGGMYKLSQWETQTEGEKLLKFCLMVAGSAYLAHLAMDACTKRSLLLLGKI
jgi:inner membrane protein